MKGSLISREVIADSIELFVRAHAFDAVVAICGCDKTIPGTVMALARLNLPSLSLYGGSIMPGQFHGHDVTIQDVFEAVGACAAGKMTRAEVVRTRKPRVSRRRRVRRPVHGQHHGHGDHVSRNFADGRKRSSRDGSAKSASRDRLRQAGDGASTRRTFARSRSSRTRRLQNAIASVAATGGSTNAVLHLLAIARDAGVPLTHRRIRQDFREDSPPRRSEARRPIHRAGHVPRGRHAAARQASAGSGAAARRPHRLRQEPLRGNSRRAAKRRARK